MPYRIHRGRSRMSGGFIASAMAAGVGLAALAGHHAAAVTGSDAIAAPARAAAAIAYARAQIGKPYLWGGTGPDAFDCSGLVMEAYASAGIAIPRTSQEQWASLPHEPGPEPGYLVFAPGSDGTLADPGHVALVIGGGQVIQAYAASTPVEVSSLASFAAGSGGITGYARPWGGA